MSQPAKAQEPSMEEILASIRRIIADDDTAKPAAAAARRAAAAPRRLPPRIRRRHRRRDRAASAPPPPAMDQRDIDAMLAELDAPPAEPHADDVLDLTEQMAAPAEDETPSFQTIDGQPDVIFTDRAGAAGARRRAWPRSRARRAACAAARASLGPAR